MLFKNEDNFHFLLSMMIFNVLLFATHKKKKKKKTPNTADVSNKSFKFNNYSVGKE